MAREFSQDPRAVRKRMNHYANTYNEGVKNDPTKKMSEKLHDKQDLSSKLTFEDGYKSKLTPER